MGTCVVLLGIGFVLTPPADDEPGFAIAEDPVQLEDGSWRVTLDTSDHERWVGINFGLGRTVPEGLAADVMVRRYVLRAPRGAVDLGEVPLADAIAPDKATWLTDLVDGDHRNPALAHWYEYSYLQHTLSSRDHAYAVQTTEGNTLLAIESYRCENGDNGCMTLRYRPVSRSSSL